MKIKQANKGITLIALVITIIVLLILAGVTIAMLTGENGILNQANVSKENTIIGQEKEQIQLAYSAVKIKKATEGENLSVEEEMKTALKNDGITEEKAFVKTEREKITVTYTQTLHKYIIEEDGSIKGPIDANAPPDLEVSDIELKITPSTWTAGSVIVEITNKITFFELQYSLNGTNWERSQNQLTVTDNNQAIYLRFVNEKGEAGEYATVNITNIDRLIPNNFTPTATSTTNSITIVGSTTDQTATNTNGSSGIDKYYFSKDDGRTWEPSEGEVQTTWC